MKDEDYIKIYLVVQITLVVLKLFRIINWSWKWILLPTIIPLVLSLIIAIIIVIKEYINFK